MPLVFQPLREQARRDRLHTVSLETPVPFRREERHKVVFQAHMQQSPTSKREIYVCTAEILPILLRLWW